MPQFPGPRAAFLAVALAMAGAHGVARGDAAPVAAGTVKMAIVYTLGKFVEWPATALNDDPRAFTLCILGPTADLQQGLAAIDAKPVQGRELRVRRLVSTAGLPGCRILYLSEPGDSSYQSVLSKAHALNILTVSDASLFTESGGIVGLETRDSRIRFSVNLDGARAANLRISSELLRLARSVSGTERD